MGRLIVFVAVVAVLTTAAVWLANDPGTVSLTWRGWQVDTSVGLLIAAVIVAVIVILLILRAAAAIGGTVKAFAMAQRERRFKRGLASLGDGFAAVQAGHKKAAKKLAREAEALLHDNPAVLLLRKDVAALEGDAGEVKSAAEAMLARAETEVAGLRTLAQKAATDGDVMGALSHARRALERKDAPAWALSMVLDLEIATEHWADALAALESRLGREAFSPPEHKRLKSRLLTKQAQSLLRGGDANGAAVAAKKAVDADEDNYHAVSAFAKAMTMQGKGRKAASAVERAWSEAPHAELLAAYKALVPGESALEWAARVESLARAAPNHAESKLAVAEASLAAELWGQARNRLQGLTGEETPADIRARAVRILADVENLERGDSDRAAAWLKLALAIHHAPARVAPQPKSAAELLAQA